MKLPPSWKVKRELHTAGDQIAALAWRILDPFRRVIYDHKELRDISVHDGHQPLHGKLVIYLVYQPSGLAPSQFEAVTYLQSHGYAVLLVANGGLHADDVHKLKRICWRIIERSNQGYDFGGYRCGLHYIQQTGILPEVLTLMNDSVCFPLLADSDLLQLSEECISDFGGAVGLDELPPWHGQLILSYWMTIKQSLWKSKDFWKFWREYVPASNKTYTVKYGERGLSRRLNSLGRSVRGVYTCDLFMQTMHTATLQQLRLTLQYAALVDHDFETECARLLSLPPEAPGWRKACLDFVERVARRRNFLNAFCYPSVALLRVPFIKKSPLRLQVLAREQYLRAVLAGDLPAPPQAVLEDIKRCTEIA